MRETRARSDAGSRAFHATSPNDCRDKSYNIFLHLLLQVSGIKFAFDPKRPSGKRVERDLVRIGDEYVKADGVYHMVSDIRLK